MKKKEEVYSCFAIRADRAGGTLLRNCNVPMLFQKKKDAWKLPLVVKGADTVVRVRVKVEYPEYEE